jgi:hypothetical protein
MNKIGYQPLPVLLRADSSDARTSKSAKILWTVATLGTLLALSGAVAICLIGFNAVPHKTLELKAPVDVPVIPETTMSPAAVTGRDESTAIPVPDSSQTPRQTIAEDRSLLDQTAAPALNPTSTPAAPPITEAPVSESGSLKEKRAEIGQANPARRLTEAARKKLEKMRLAAERSRSRLEELYRTNTISSDAYKKGVEKYQRVIQRYRREMSAGIGPKTEVAGQN